MHKILVIRLYFLLNALHVSYTYCRTMHGAYNVKLTDACSSGTPFQKKKKNITRSASPWPNFRAENTQTL